MAAARHITPAWVFETETSATLALTSAGRMGCTYDGERTQIFGDVRRGLAKISLASVYDCYTGTDRQSCGAFRRKKKRATSVVRCRAEVHTLFVLAARNQDHLVQATTWSSVVSSWRAVAGTAHPGPERIARELPVPEPLRAGQ